MLRTAGTAALALSLLSFCGPPEVGQAPARKAVYTRGRAELAQVATTDSFTSEDRDGYDRSCGGSSECLFGRSWTDNASGVALAHNGCDTRNDVLARDLTDVRRRGSCKVLSGILDDPYTGRTIRFSSKQPQAVQIDHVVALSYAWRAGARSWTTQRRTALANDPDNLRAVDGEANESKGDAGPGEWLPENTDHRCSYVLAWTTVVRRYGLTVLAEDWKVADQVLQACESAAPA